MAPAAVQEEPAAAAACASAAAAAAAVHLLLPLQLLLPLLLQPRLMPMVSSVVQALTVVGKQTTGQGIQQPLQGCSQLVAGMTHRTLLRLLLLQLHQALLRFQPHDQLRLWS